MAFLIFLGGAGGLENASYMREVPLKIFPNRPGGRAPHPLVCS